MTRGCIPLYKPLDNGNITFSRRRQSSTLITSLCSLYKCRENYKNDCHQKWSTYLQKFHLNIIYKKASTNRVTDFLSRPLVATLTTVLDYCGHETSGWSQLYANNPDFVTTYQMLGAGTPIANFLSLRWPAMPLGSPLCSLKQACEADFGSPLQSGGKTL